MQENVRKQIRKAKERKKRMRRLCAIILCLSILVAGTVSWQLVLPGVAMSGETYCGKEEHTHSEACYGKNFICGKEEGAGAHTHTEDCYTEVRTDELICGQEESSGHTHTEECCTAPQELTCGQEEYPEHTHTEECCATIQELTCGQEESPEHAHTEDCYTEVRTDELICGQEESPGHTHTEECYTAPQELTCGQEEHPEHIHTEECYATDQKLTCDQEEGAGHVHTDECCETGTELTCGQEEHTHSAQCYSNPDAVETEDEWKAAFAEYQLTGEWGIDIAAIAKSQVGYAENTENYSVSEDGSQKGYTRYADWAGDDLYGDWDAYFAAFVLSYAGVPEDQFPVNAEDPEQWITDMQNSGYYTTDADAKMEAGDLVILEKTDQDRAQQFGIISEVETDEDGNADIIKVVEGNVDNEVKENTYSVSGGEIVGYGLVSAAYEAYTGTEEDMDQELEQVQNLSEPPSVLGNSSAPNNVSTLDSGETLDKRLEVFVTGKTGENGQTLDANIVVTHSDPKDENPPVVKVNISDLPEGVTLAGFNENNELTVRTSSESATGEQTVTVKLHYDTNGKPSFISFTPPAGSTMNFYLQFNSKNGIMEKESKVTLTPEIENPAENDSVSESADLIWTGKNVWNPVDKTVDRTIIPIEGNSLQGELIYTIKADSLNGDGAGDSGDIWTQEVLITDTLTLPNGITFPADANVQWDGAKASIVTSNGETLFSFTDLQGGKVTKLELSGDKKTVTYQVTVPNSHMQDGVPTEEQDNLSLSLKLDASKLVLADGYIAKGQTAISKDEIKNHVSFESIPYKDYDHCKSEDTVVTTPYIVESFDFKKTSKQEEVSAGETIRYTISITNTGSQTILGQDGENPYYVTDKLPDYLELTNEQIEALVRAGATYDPSSHTIQWKPGDIGAGETKSLDFDVTVKSAVDVGNISTIQNTASYKDKQDSETIQYKKPEIKLTKESDVEGEVGNGDEITYTIVIENKGSTPVTGEKITDQLPSGLEMLYVLDKGNSQIIPGTESFQAGSTASSGEHTVKWTYSGQTHTWELGTLEAGEKVTIRYVCKVNTDKINGTTLKNNVTTTTGETDSDEVPVKQPIRVEKQVKGEDDKEFGDGGSTYDDGTKLTYRISITNDAQKPNMAENHTLVDKLPTGVLLSDEYKIYKRTDQTDLKDLTSEKLVADETITSWREFALLGQWDSRYTIINGDVVKVTPEYGDGTQQKLTLTWFIGKIEPGTTVTKTYNAQISLSNNQNTSSTDVELTNTASVGYESDSVTIKGKSYSLIIKKYILGDLSYDQLTPEQKEQIKFQITRVNKDGTILYAEDGITPKYQTEISLKDFSNNWNGTGSYVIGSLEKGYYKIEETATGDYSGTVTVTIDGQNGTDAIVEITENQSQVNVEIRNNYGESGTTADVQKSVWTITDQKDQHNAERLKSKYLFGKSENLGNYVIYNITVMNTGEHNLLLDTLVDEMDPGLQYIGMRSNLDNATISDFNNPSIKTQQWNAASKISIDGQDLANDVAIKAEATEDGRKVTFHVGEDGEGYSLPSGKSLSFFVMCKVMEDAKVNEPLTNTVDLIVDGSVSYKEYDGLLTMKDTAADENQNNGESIDEGVKDGKRTISSSVSVMPAEVIIPGITKTTSAYIRPEGTTETTIGSHDNIYPNSIVRWTVELRNDGTIPIVGYTIEDSVESPFHILSQDEYNKSPALKDVNVFTLEIYNEDGTMKTSTDLSNEIWNQVTDDKTSEFSVTVTNDDFAIPPGGKAYLYVYTNNTVIAYNIYENTATFIPEQDFSGNDVIHGQLVTDENGRVTGVQASDSVYALGDYGSFSWKSVEEEGNSSNIGYGYQGQEGKNYITVGEDTETVIYTNNIENLSGYDFTGLSMIDLMPIPGDTGVLNQSRERDSEFTISFLESLELYICDSSTESTEKTLLDNTQYYIQFSSKVSFTDEDFDGTSSEEWHDEWQEGDKSFRIVFDESVVLKTKHVLTMEYKGHIEADADPGEIAWNSFGYQYMAGNPDMPASLQKLKAEPPKVGVKIPEKAIIKKVVLDSSGAEAAYDEEVTFNFELYEGDTASGEMVTSFTLYQGEAKSLNEIKKPDGTPAFENGVTYTVKEIPASGYETVSIGQEGTEPVKGDTYTFTYYRAMNSINIVVTNRVIAYELPETGGIGTTGYFTGGAALMLASGLLGGTRMRRKRERRGR